MIVVHFFYQTLVPQPPEAKKQGLDADLDNYFGGVGTDDAVNAEAEEDVEAAGGDEAGADEGAEEAEAAADE